MNAKRIISACITAVLLFTVCFATVANAAKIDFIKSPGKGGLEVVEIDNHTDGEIIVTPFADRKKDEFEIFERLETLYKKILGAETDEDFQEILDEISKMKDIPKENLAVAELFDVFFRNVTEDADGYYSITLKADTIRRFKSLVYYRNGEWGIVNDTKLDGNKLKFKFDRDATFAILVDKTDKTNTGDTSALPILYIVLAVSAAGLVTVLFLMKKNKSK